MKARKLISNSPDVMAAIPTEDRATEFTINDSQDPVTKTLGLSWNSVNDVLTIPKSSKPAEFDVTKRNVLSKIATIFDPLGFISPVVVKAKIILQKLWSQGYEWDEEVIFNPPAAPHFGGVHEIMVKSAKRAIYGVLGNSEVTDEELITAFSGVKSLINSRLLTYQTTDSRDDTPPTPNHFLHGQMGGDFAPETEMTVFSPKNRWRKVQDLIS